MKLAICLLLLSIPFLNYKEINKKTVGRALVSPINWADTKDWRLYKVPPKGSFAFSLDTLRQFKYTNLSQDTMKSFLQEVSEIPPERTPVWMGYYVATCQLPDGNMLKIEISQYGSFFYAEKEKKYYHLKENVGRDWLSYLAQKWLELEDASK
jgi:hypothetical protein